MQLVHFLVSGVAGAEDGTATFVLRGTASSAASVLYSDFEGTTQPGTNIITLDSNGAAEIYCDAYCDVTLKNEAGATIRTVTVGNSATTVEVISDSFTGTDYSGSPTAVSEPITLAAVLDKWNNSAGATNWQVSVGGVATNLSSAFASIAGIYFNVKDPAYGAVGDGVTDDTTAIANAIAASNGSIVFFPPGTYKVSTLTITDSNYNLLGSGPGSSIISGYQAGTSMVILDNSVEGFGTICQLGFAATAAYTNGIAINPTQNVQFTNCHIDTTNMVSGVTNLDFDGGSYVLMNGCFFTVDTASDFAVSNLADDGECSFVLSSCSFEVEALFNGSIISGPDFNVSNCTFDASAITSGTYYHIDAESNETTGRYLGTFTGNTIIDGGSSGYAFKLTDVSTGCNLVEENNQFSGFTEPTAVTDPGQIYNVTTSASHLDAKIVLGSRRGKVLRFTVAGSPINPQCQVMAEIVIIDSTSLTDPTVIDLDNSMISGQEFTIIAVNATTDFSQKDFAFTTDHQSISTVNPGPAFGGKSIARFISYTKAAGDEEFMILTAGEIANA
jgi:hypothetical protein